MNKRIKYPIFYFDYHICIHCGSRSVVAIDKFGRESSDIMLYPISYMKCKKCGTVYNIRWIKDNDRYIPTCCDVDSKRDIERNVLEYSISQQRHI